MAVTSSDKILLGSAFVLALASGVAFGIFVARHPGGALGPLPPLELSADSYVAKAPDAPPIKTETWSPPTAQKRGREWIYDTFTPPDIFYNARSKQFTVKPPSSLLDDEQRETFGLELLSVRPEPFRLQLIGYVGAEGNWRGVFQNVLTGETIVAGAGRRMANLALSVQRLEVTPQDIALPQSMSSRQPVAVAVIRDEKAGRDVTLTHRERVFTGTLFAFVSAEGSANSREVRVGDNFKLGDASYRIDKITTTPPAIEVTKEAPTLTMPEQRILTPRELEPSDLPETSERGG